MNVDTKSLAARPPRLALAMAAALFLVSIGAMAIQHFGNCGTCTVRQGPWKLVAPVGTFGYGVLTAMGLWGPYRLFPIGSALAAAVHTVLVAAMAVGSWFCPICIAAATLALGLFLVMLVRSASRLKIVACVYVPAVLLASGPTAWALSRDEAVKGEREAFARAIRDSRSGANLDAVLTIQVFEQDHCSYCRDFREMYLPRLDRDFAGRVRVRFLQATTTTWVRRTPTIVVEGGPVYEGLPENYSELRDAVERALSAGK